MRPIHDRMPVILEAENHDDWLKSTDKSVLMPFGEEMTSYPISRRVNSPENDSKEVIEETIG